MQQFLRDFSCMHLNLRDRFFFAANKSASYNFGAQRSSHGSVLTVRIHFPFKSSIKNRFNVKLHLFLYLPYSPTQFSSCIRKLFYLHLHHQENIFQLLVTTRTGFYYNFKTFISYLDIRLTSYRHLSHSTPAR
jgi:hypothetical protein